MFYCVPVLLNEFPHGDNKVVALAAALWLCQFSLKGHWVTIIMVHFKLPCGVPSQSLLQNIQLLENKQFLMTRTNLHYKWTVAHSAVISNTHTHFLSLTHTHTHTYTFSHTHTHTHTHFLSYTHAQTNSHTTCTNTFTNWTCEHLKGWETVVHLTVFSIDLYTDIHKTRAHVVSTELPTLRKTWVTTQIYFECSTGILTVIHTASHNW